MRRFLFASVAVLIGAGSAGCVSETTAFHSPDGKYTVVCSGAGFGTLRRQQTNQGRTHNFRDYLATTRRARQRDRTNAGWSDGGCEETCRRDADQAPLNASSHSSRAEATTTLDSVSHDRMSLDQQPARSGT